MSPTAAAAPQCVGIDVGTHAACIAVAQGRGADVLLNAESSRETPSLVSYGPRQRYAGVHAEARAAMHPAETVAAFKRLLARGAGDEGVGAEVARLPFKVVAAAADGRGSNSNSGDALRVAVPYGGRAEALFAPEQVTAAFLYDLKSLADQAAAEAGGGGNGSSSGSGAGATVLAVPAWFNAGQRRAMLAAARVAGLSDASLINDTTAAALEWAAGRIDVRAAAGGSPAPAAAAAASPAAAPVTVTVAFVDVGASSTQAAVIDVSRLGVAVRGCAWDANLGGRDFDELLYERLVAAFQRKNGGRDARAAGPRAAAKLRRAAERAKRTLSANADAQVSVECLAYDLDLPPTTLSRSDFEADAAPLLARIKAVASAALADARRGGGTVRLAAVELLGNGSRVPCVAAAIGEALGAAPARTLHAKEAICRGAALAAALRFWGGAGGGAGAGHHPPAAALPAEFVIREKLPAALAGAWLDARGRRAWYELLSEGHTYPASKTATLAHAPPLEIELASVAGGDGHDGGGDGATVVSTGKFVVGDRSFKLPRLPRGAPPPVTRVTIEVDASGIAAVARAAVVDPSISGAASPNRTPPHSPTARHHLQQQQRGGGGGDGLPDAGVLARPPIVAAWLPGPSAADVEKWAREEAAMAAQDAKQRAAQEARNALEAAVYATRDAAAAAAGGGSGKAGGKAAAALTKELDALESWLYSDAADAAPREEHEARLARLRAAAGAAGVRA